MKVMHWIPGTVSSIVAVILLGGCGQETESPSPVAQRESAVADCRDCNVVFVVSDTLRAQQLGLYGYDRPTSERLDRLGNEGAWFEYAQSQASCTYPSAHSMLTGLYPARFLGKRINRVPEEIPIMAEIFRENGYATYGVSGSPIVTSVPNQFSQGGFERGFDEWTQSECEEEDCTWRFTPRAATINSHGLPHLAAEQPFFLYLHYMDAHTPLQSPLDEFSGESTSQYAWLNEGNTNPLENMFYSGGPRIEMTGDDRAHMVNQYDDEVLYFDQSVGVLLDEIERLGLAENTIVVVAADHGEEMLEHESVKHCHTLYDTETRTPLIFRIPGVSPGRIQHAAGNVDILPTLIDFVGIDDSPYALEGISLRASLTGKGRSREHVFSAQGSLRSVSDGRYHLIYDLESDSVELFDRVADPAEKKDLSLREQGRASELLLPLRDWLARIEGLGDSSTREEALEKARVVEEHLKAIGYVD